MLSVEVEDFDLVRVVSEVTAMFLPRTRRSIAHPIPLTPQWLPSTRHANRAGASISRSSTTACRIPTERSWAYCCARTAAWKRWRC